MKKILLTAFLIFFTNQSFAEVTEDEVKKFAEKIGTEIITIANKKIPEEDKKSQVVSLIDENVDANWIARFVLGKHYRRATLEQKNEFVDLYRQFMINTYGPKFKNYNGLSFTVTEVAKRKRFYLVKAELLQRDTNVPILVDFRVKNRNEKLIIIDVIAEGISLIETQRSEFNSAISQNGMVEFLKILRERVEKLKV